MHTYYIIMRIIRWYSTLCSLSYYLLNHRCMSFGRISTRVIGIFRVSSPFHTLSAYYNSSTDHVTYQDLKFYIECDHIILDQQLLNPFWVPYNLMFIPKPSFLVSSVLENYSALLNRASGLIN